VNNQKHQNRKLRKVGVAQTHQGSNHAIHVFEVRRLQQAGLADMSHHGPESRFHEKLTEQQRWHGDEQSSVNAIVPQ
jgi:hypothetical protein